MRVRYFCFFSFIFLVGCAGYGDNHSSATVYTPSQLSILQKYTIPSYNSTSKDWWSRFNDPQLNQLIEIALKDSPNMLIVENRVKRSAQMAQGANASLWPSVEFNSYLQHQKFSKFGLIPPPFNGKIYNIADLGFNFNYEFDFWGQHREALAAAITEKYAAEADKAESRLLLSAAVASAYFALLENTVQKEIAHETLLKTETISHIIVDRTAHGIESDIPVKTALIDTQTARLRIEQYKQNEQLMRNKLAILLGKNPFSTEIMTPRFIYHHYDISLPNNLTANILASRPDINAAKLRAEVAARQINVAKTKFFPNINLNALLSYQSIQLNHLFETQSQNNLIGGAIDLPIFDAGARRANLGIKYAEYDIAVNDYNQTILNALHEVADQYSVLNTLDSQIKAQNIAVRANRDNYKLFHSRYRHGVIDYLPVLELQQVLLEQKAELLHLQIQHLQATVAMIKALGGTSISKQDAYHDRSDRS